MVAMLIIIGKVAMIVVMMEMIKKFDPKKSHGVGDKIMMLIRIIMKKNLILKSLI